MKKLQSIRFNLKDKENDLALRVIYNQFEPKDLVLKDASELASEKKKQQTQAVLDEHLAASRTDLMVEIKA